MGRPLNKRYFGSGAGAQLRVRAKIGANTEGDGVIVSQRGTRKFKVTVGANTGDCYLVDKADGTLLDNEMSITVLTDDGVLRQVSKITAHRATTAAGQFAWTFDPSTTDGKVQIEEVETAFPALIISITAQPESVSVTTGLSTSFSVTATVTQGVVPSYQWYVNDTVTWSMLTEGSGYTGVTSDTLVIDAVSEAQDGYQYRVVVEATGATPVTSTAATLTVTS